MKILIVDDSATARMFIKRCLEISGFRDAEIFEAENGKEGHELVKKHKFKIIFSDLIMPEWDGEKLLRAVKSNPRFTNLPVVIITSAGHPSTEKRLLDGGAYAIIQKPISPAKLTPILNKIENNDEEELGW